MNEKNELIEQDFDPDTAPDLSTDGWPEKIAKVPVRKGDPLLGTPLVPITIDLSEDVIEYFQSGGPDWQSRIDDALRDWIEFNSALGKTRD